MGSSRMSSRLASYVCALRYPLAQPVMGASQAERCAAAHSLLDWSARRAGASAMRSATHRIAAIARHPRSSAACTQRCSSLPLRTLVVDAAVVFVVVTSLKEMQALYKSEIVGRACPVIEVCPRTVEMRLSMLLKVVCLCCSATCVDRHWHAAAIAMLSEPLPFS